MNDIILERQGTPRKDNSYKQVLSWVYKINIYAEVCIRKREVTEGKFTRFKLNLCVIDYHSFAFNAFCGKYNIYQCLLFIQK